jgi:hypothetical protein
MNIKILLLSTGIFFIGNSISQVGIGTTNPASSAELDITSTSKGFLVPRMTQVQRNAIASPVAGLQVWCSNCGNSGELQIYNGTTWTNLIGGSASVYVPAVGSSYQGGKVAYIFVSGDPGYVAGQTHGIIATIADQGTTTWGCSGTLIAGADGVILGTGNQNTIDIIAGCPEAAIAARLCGDLVEGGYSDWFLPSRNELEKIWINRTAVGGFVSTGFYLSSTENISTNVLYVNFTNGAAGYALKTSSYYVRAVRTF